MHWLYPDYIKMSKKIAIFRTMGIWLLGVISLGLSFSWITAQDEATKLSQADYIREFYNTMRDKGWIPSKYANRKWLITVFCNTIFSDNLIQWFYHQSTDGSYLQFRPYSPKDSLFAFLLCNSLDGSTNLSANAVGESSNKTDIQSIQSSIQLLNQQINSEQGKTNPNSSTIEQLTTQRDNLLIVLANTVELGQHTIPYIWADYIKYKQVKDIIKDGNCVRSTNLNSCSISTHLSKLFHQIINDYTNSKIAWIYWYIAHLSPQQEQNSKSLREWATQISDFYFSKCGDSETSQFIYTNKDQIDNWELAYCSHPNTYKVLVNFMQNAQAKVAKNKIVDYNRLVEKGQNSLLYKGVASHCSQTGTMITTLDCGLDDYQHLVMNELLYYGLFMEFYSSYVTSSEQFAPLSIGKDKAVTQEVLDEEQRKVQLELEVATHAIQQDFKIIRNLFAKFPIHIGMVAYLEDLVSFRNELVKLYTPIHQMYYKLRNAQTYKR